MLSFTKAGKQVLGVEHSGVQVFRYSGIEGSFSLIPCALLLALLLLAGCGGGGKNAKGTTAGNGRATFTILWPKLADGRLSRVIPSNAQSIEITITAPTNANPPVWVTVGDQTVNAPTNAPFPTDPNGNRISTASFTQLPVGTLRLTAIAYSKANAQGDVVARADNQALIITNGLTTNQPISLISTVASVKITKPPGFTTLIPGQTLQLGVSAYAADGTTSVPVAPDALTWTSSDTTNSIAVIDNNGLVTVKSTGTFTVTVVEAASKQTDSFTFTVNPGTIQSITIVQTSPFALPVGKTATLTADLRDSSGNPLTLTGLIWNTDTPSVVQINSQTGDVTGLKVGTALVTVSEPRSNRISPALRINVGAGTLNTVMITPSTIPALKSGDTVTLTASAQDAAGNAVIINDSNWAWSISDKSVASINGNGASTDSVDAVSGTTVRLIGKRSGTASITLMETGSGLGKKTSVPVTVNIGVTIAPIGPVIARGMVQCTATVTGAVSNPKVDWSVQEPDGGAIDKITGLYTAPNKVGIFHIIATSQEDGKQQDMQPVTVSLGSGTITVQ